MAKNRIIVIEISSSSESDEEESPSKGFFPFASSSSDEEESPLKTLFASPSSKTNSAMKDEFKKKKKEKGKTKRGRGLNYNYEDDDCFIAGEDEDCFILDFDPFESMEKLNIEEKDEETDDLTVVAERGQVACRDYPHSRHLCAKFPFDKTSHSSHCQQCYCYVCDLVAPCTNWSLGPWKHCDATDDDIAWKIMRQDQRCKA